MRGERPVSRVGRGRQHTTALLVARMSPSPPLAEDRSVTGRGGSQRVIVHPRRSGDGVPSNNWPTCCSVSARTPKLARAHETSSWVSASTCAPGTCAPRRGRRGDGAKMARARTRGGPSHVSSRLRVLCHVMAHSRRCEQGEDPLVAVAARRRWALLSSRHPTAQNASAASARAPTLPVPNPSKPAELRRENSYPGRAASAPGRLPPPSSPERSSGGRTRPSTPLSWAGDRTIGAYPRTRFDAPQEMVARIQLPTLGKRWSPQPSCRCAARGGRPNQAADARQEVVAPNKLPTLGKRWSPQTSCRCAARGGRPKQAADARQEVVAPTKLPMRGKRWSHQPTADARQEVVARNKPPMRGKRWSPGYCCRREA